MKIQGGNAPLFYANNLLKFVSSDKYSMEKDGFDGFKVRIELIKSRTNKAGQSVSLVYDQDNGFDALRSMYMLADESNLIEGRNPYRYIKGYPDFKFDSRDFNKLSTDTEFKRNLYTAVYPILTGYLGNESKNENSNTGEMSKAEYIANVALPALFDDDEE